MVRHVCSHLPNSVTWSHVKALDLKHAHHIVANMCIFVISCTRKYSVDLPVIYHTVYVLMSNWYIFHLMLIFNKIIFWLLPQITKFMGPIWGPPGSCRPQMGPMLAPWSMLSGYSFQLYMSQFAYNYLLFLPGHRKMSSLLWPFSLNLPIWTANNGVLKLGILSNHSIYHKPNQSMLHLMNTLFKCAVTLWIIVLSSYIKNII